MLIQLLRIVQVFSGMFGAVAFLALIGDEPSPAFVSLSTGFLVYYYLYVNRSEGSIITYRPGVIVLSILAGITSGVMLHTLRLPGETDVAGAILSTSIVLAIVIPAIQYFLRRQRDTL